MKLKTNIDSGMFEVIQLAGAAALNGWQEGDVESMKALYTGRRDLVVDALRKIGVQVESPKASIYVWAPVPEGFESSEAFAEHVLNETDVVVSPGSMFGDAGEGFFRISLTTPDERLEEAVERIGNMKPVE